MEEIVTAVVGKHLADAKLKLAKAEDRDLRTVNTPANHPRRMQNGRDVRFARLLAESWQAVYEWASQGDDYRDAGAS